jgi:hypothetical protein
MRLTQRLYWIAFSLFISASTVTLAQDVTCPVIVRTALDATDEACADTGRNQACYGNINLDAEPQPGIEDFSFTAPGDLVDIAGVQTLTLSPLIQEENTWGVALMKLQANLPDTLPGQNVTFLLFGDVEIQNAVSSNVEAASVEGAAAGVTLKVNINSMVPLIESLDGSSTAMPEMLNAGTTATADGYFEMAQMIHVVLEDGKQGWLPTAMVNIEGDVTTLPAIDPTGLLMPTEEAAEPTSEFTPMQAFYFKSGANDAPCEEAPDSGILIQTPEGAGKIDLVVNDARVSLGSTGYFQAQAGGEMTVIVVEGEGVVESAGSSVTVPAGTQARVPLDENLQASGAPEGPEPYDPDSLRALPIGNLPQTIEIAPALELTEVADATDTITPQPGPWTSTYASPVVGGGCDPMIAQAFTTNWENQTTGFTMPEGSFDLQAMMETNSGDLPGSVSYSHPEANFYVMDASEEGTTLRYEFRFVSETEISMAFMMNFEGCDITIPGTMLANG